MKDFSEAKALLIQARTLLKERDGLVPVDQRRLDRVDEYVRFALAGLDWFEPEPTNRWAQDVEAGAIGGRSE